MLHDELPSFRVLLSIACSLNSVAGILLFFVSGDALKESKASTRTHRAHAVRVHTIRMVLTYLYHGAEVTSRMWCVAFGLATLGGVIGLVLVPSTLGFMFVLRHFISRRFHRKHQMQQQQARVATEMEGTIFVPLPAAQVACSMFVDSVWPTLEVYHVATLLTLTEDFTLAFIGVWNSMHASDTTSTAPQSGSFPRLAFLLGITALLLTVRIVMQIIVMEQPWGKFKVKGKRTVTISCLAHGQMTGGSSHNPEDRLRQKITSSEPSCIINVDTLENTLNSREVRQEQEVKTQLVSSTNTQKTAGVGFESTKVPDLPTFALSCSKKNRTRADGRNSSNSSQSSGSTPKTTRTKKDRENQSRSYSKHRRSNKADRANNNSLSITNQERMSGTSAPSPTKNSHQSKGTSPTKNSHQSKGTNNRRCSSSSQRRQKREIGKPHGTIKVTDPRIATSPDRQHRGHKYLENRAPRTVQSLNRNRKKNPSFISEDGSKIRV